MKILLVSETLDTGGAETFVVRLANALCAAHEVRLFVFYRDLINPQIEAQVDERVKIITGGSSAKSLTGKFDSVLLKLNIDYSAVHNSVENALKKEVQNFAPDVVHSHLFKPDYLVAKIKSHTSQSFKHVITIHGDYSAYYFGTADARMKNSKEKISQVIEKADHIVCICNEHFDFFKNNFPAALNKISKIYNGYLPSNNGFKSVSKDDLKLPGDRFIFIMVSRGVKLKGWQKAVDAFKQAALPDAVLILVGDGDYLSELKTNETNPAIVFAGFSANPVEYIQHADVCLLPSLFPYESLPTVVMEYLYCKKPVIATRVGEIPEMITTPGGEKAGVLLSFDQNDVKVDELAAALDKMYNDSQMLNECKLNAGKAFGKFDMAACTQKYLKVYNSR